MGVGQVFILSLIVCHGLIHLVGFSNAFGFRHGLLHKRIEKAAGVCWLITSLAFLLTAVLYIFDEDSWTLLAMVFTVLSQVLIITVWKDARVGTVANVLIFVVAWLNLSGDRFNRHVNHESANLIKHASPGRAGMVTGSDLERLPFPVKRWLMKTGVTGKEIIHVARLKQYGRMRTTPGGRWMPFSAVQYFNADKPAFVWKASVDMFPLVKLQGFDQFSGGEGAMQIKLMSMINVVNASGDKKIDSATMTRYLAEIIWFPTAALNSYLEWQAVDSQKATVIMRYGELTASATFMFDDGGDVRRIVANRYKDSGEKASLEKWIVDMTGYNNFNGLRIASQSRVTWGLKEGDFTWAEVTITDLDYNTYQLFDSP